MADGYAQTGSTQRGTEQALSEFLAELTDLSRRTGIGINGNPELYVMETEDKMFSYGANAASRLTLV